jgi:hypothetical protein
LTAVDVGGEQAPAVGAARQVSVLRLVGGDRLAEEAHRLVILVHHDRVSPWRVTAKVAIFSEPVIYQAATQLGYPTVADDHLMDVLRFPARTWHAASCRRLARARADSYVYEAAGANHGANLNQLDPAEAAEPSPHLRRWAGCPPRRCAAASRSPTRSRPRPPTIISARACSPTLVLLTSSGPRGPLPAVDHQKQRTCPRRGADLPPRPLAVDHGLLSVSKRMRAKLGVTGNQRMLLRFVAHFPRCRRVIWRACCTCTPSTLTGTLRLLESRGFLKREGDPADGRRALFTLTKRGSQVAGVRRGPSRRRCSARWRGCRRRS